MTDVNIDIEKDEGPYLGDLSVGEWVMDEGGDTLVIIGHEGKETILLSLVGKITKGRPSSAVLRPVSQAQIKLLY